jgi:excisionase family DNA binding protein
MHNGGIQMLEYISVQQAADQWGISKRRIQKLCEENRIFGALRFGRAWAIPKDTPKPVDGRLKENRKKE